MPVKKIEQIKPNLFLGIWQITESIGELKDIYTPFTSIKEKNIKNQNKLKEHYAALCILKTLVENQNLTYHGLAFHDSGKPFLKNNSSLNISITHSYPYAAVCLSDKLVGVDIEHYQERLIRLKHKYLSPVESKEIKDNLHKLTHAWAAKEALYKLKGKPVKDYGLNLSLTTFHFNANQQNYGSVEFGQNKIEAELFYLEESDFSCVIAEEITQ